MSSSTMRAIGLEEFGAPECFKWVDVPAPIPEPRDLIVEVKASSVNPVDCKQRSGKYTPGQPDRPVVLGYDVAGVVRAVGSSSDGRFKVGDEVFFAGSNKRRGGLGQLVAVDERIVGPKPRSLSFAEAAALPLTSITAWEGLFERAGLGADVTTSSTGKTALVVGGAGGAGSIGVQLLKRVAGFTVIATASRPETEAYCKELGADFVITHSRAMKPQLEEIGHPAVDVIYNTASPDDNLEELFTLLAPQGKIVGILPRVKPISLAPIFGIAGTLVFEMMFTRPSFGVDLDKQGALLNRISRWVDAGILKTTMTRTFEWTPEGAAAAHAEVDSGHACGKVVIVNAAE